MAPPQLKKGPQPPKVATKTPSVGTLMKGLPNGIPKELPSGLGDGISAYQILAHRIANRVAEMAENYTVVEKPRAQPVTADDSPAAAQAAAAAQAGPKKPRKLEIRLPSSKSDDVSFSAPFLDNTLGKMLDLQRRMLTVSADIASSDAPESVKKEQYAQSAELSKIIALICAEKARQGA